MTMRECKDLSHQIYSSHRVNSWIIGIICGLFISAIVLLGLLFSGLELLFVPFLMLPFFFACMVSHYDLSREDYLTGKKLFRFFRLFFSINFYSSFGILRSFFKALLIELIVSVLGFGVTFLIFSKTSSTFNETIKTLFELIQNNELTTKAFNDLLAVNNDELYHFFYINTLLSSCAFSLAFTFFISKEALSVYLRLSFNQSPMTNGISRIAMKKIKKPYLKAFLYCNWTLFVLMLLGMVSGSFFAIYFLKDYSVSSTVAVSFGLAFTSLFLPFYFSNMEAIYKTISIDIRSASEEYVKTVFGKYGMKIDVDTHEVVDGEKKDPSDGSNE